MAYCTIETVKEILTKNITIGDTKVLDPVDQQKPDTFATKTAGKFINLASQYIDSRLSTIYLTPLQRIKTHEEALLQDMANNTSLLQIADNGPYTVGSFVRLTDQNGTFLFTVSEVCDDPGSIGQVELLPKANRTWAASNTTVSIVAYPDPIPDTCARLAVSMLMEKEYVAQQAPDVSNYGTELRKHVANVIDKILTGAIRLQGQEHTGRRFQRITLRDTWSTTADVTQGGEK